MFKNNIFTTLFLSIVVLTSLRAQFERGGNILGGGFSVGGNNNFGSEQDYSSIGSDYFRFISPTWGIGFSASGSYSQNESQPNNFNPNAPQIALKSRFWGGGLGVFARRIKPINKSENLSLAFTFGAFYSGNRTKTDTLDLKTNAAVNITQSRGSGISLNFAPSLLYRLTPAFFLQWRFASIGYYTSSSTTINQIRPNKSSSFYMSIYPSVLNLTLLYYWK